MNPLCEVFTIVLSHFTKVMTLPLTDITICILVKYLQARLFISSISSKRRLHGWIPPPLLLLIKGQSLEPYNMKKTTDFFLTRTHRLCITVLFVNCFATVNDVLLSFQLKPFFTRHFVPRSSLLSSWFRARSRSYALRFLTINVESLGKSVGKKIKSSGPDRGPARSTV